MEKLVDIYTLRLCSMLLYSQCQLWLLMREINLFLIRASGTKGGIKGETLDDEENSDEGDDEDYTVYECHGLAPVSCL